MESQSTAGRLGPDGTGDALDGFVADVMTIVQSQCERATDYGDIEMLVSRLPIDHLTFAAHDSLAPYSGPYPMALLVRAFLIEEINGWDETALHDHLRANVVPPQAWLRVAAEPIDVLAGVEPPLQRGTT